MSEKIAIVVDSGSDVNKKFKDQYNIKSLPLRINIEGKEYIDGVDIEMAEVLRRLEETKVTTSLPSGQDIVDALEALKNEGYTHVIVVTISSGLSGTYNAIRNISNDIDGLTVSVFDTKNISLGSGHLAIRAAQNVEKGMSFDDVVNDLHASINKSKVFFTVGSLDYLIRGGRIGHVAGTVANILNIKPIISCNEEGIYHTVDKVRGERRVIKKMIEACISFAENASTSKIELLTANPETNYDELKVSLKEAIPSLTEIGITVISPALAIHTGPEVLGISIIID